MKEAIPGPSPLQPFEHSAIYRAAEEILVNAHSIAANMPRNYRFITGATICNSSLALAKAVALAYMETTDMKRKLRLIDAVERQVTEVLALHRMGQRIPNMIDRDPYADQVKRCVSVIRQLTGWRKKVYNEGISPART